MSPDACPNLASASSFSPAPHPHLCLSHSLTSPGARVLILMGCLPHLPALQLRPCLLGLPGICLTTTRPVPSSTGSALVQRTLVLPVSKTLAETRARATLTPLLFPIPAKLPKRVVCTFCLHLAPACCSPAPVPTAFEKQLSPRSA